MDWYQFDQGKGYVPAGYVKIALENHHFDRYMNYKRTIFNL
jgi:hypothetical protein